MLNEREKFELTPQQVAERRERFERVEETVPSNVRSSIFSGETNSKIREAPVEKPEENKANEISQVVTSGPEVPSIPKDIDAERQVIESQYIPSPPKESKETPTYVSELKPHEEQIVGPHAEERRLNGRAEMAYKSNKETFEMHPLEQSGQQPVPKLSNSLYSHDAVFKPELYDRRFPEREEFTMEIRSETHPDVIEREMRSSGRMGKLGNSGTAK